MFAFICITLSFFSFLLIPAWILGIIFIGHVTHYCSCSSHFLYFLCTSYRFLMYFYLFIENQQNDDKIDDESIILFAKPHVQECQNKL